jgi:lysozyme
MKLGSKGLALIKEREGVRLTAYKCPAGVWTIGYGHTRGVKEGLKITMKEAEDYLKEDVVSCENALNALKLPFNQNQFDALVSFLYNVGTGKLSLFKPRLAKGLTNPEITDNMLKYVQANGKVLNGLVIRRQMEVSLYKS